MAAIKLSFAHFPVVLTTPPGVVTDAELSAYLDSYRKEIELRKAPFISVLDLRESAGITPAQRKMITDGMAANTSTQLYCKGAAMVFESTLLACLLTAIFWIRKPKYETKVFTNLQDALDWGRDRMQSGDLTKVA